MSDRIVHCEDALAWLSSQEVLQGCSLVGSMPDISEFQISLEEWKTWFITTAELILSRTPESGVTIFFQSDIKFQGQWVDKGHLVHLAADRLGHRLLWHKIICRAPAGATTFGRPAYSHILCFSQGLEVDVSKSTPDVIPDIGDKTWERGMGLNAALMIARFIKEQTPSQTLVNPFCGMGGVLAAANVVGLKAVGIERTKKRAEAARTLQVSEDLKRYI